MPTVTTLILATAKINGGLLVAGMTNEPNLVTGLRWVRLARKQGRFFEVVDREFEPSPCERTGRTDQNPGNRSGATEVAGALGWR